MASHLTSPIGSCPVSNLHASRYNFRGQVKASSHRLKEYVKVVRYHLTFNSLLQQELSQGRIQGLQLAWSAPIVTNLMYADDLLLMGSAETHELRRVHNTLQTFCSIWNKGFHLKV